MKTILLKSLFAFLVLILIASLALCAICYETMRRYDGRRTAGLLPPAGEFLYPEKRGVTFAVFGDFRMQLDPFREMMAKIRAARPDFMLNVGDMSAVLSTQHFNWMAEHMKREAGGIPVYATPGNHDRKKESPYDNGRHFYREVFGPSRYWFGYGNILFVSLDTADRELPEAQIEWLDSLLEQLRSRFDHLVIFTHVPPIDPRPVKEKRGLPAVQAARLEAVLKKHRVSAFFAGHQHQENLWSFAGAPLAVTPPSGQEGRGDEQDFGYLICEVTPEGAFKIRREYLDASAGTDALDFFFSSKINQSRWVFWSGIFGIIAVSLAAAGTILWLTRLKRG